MKGQRTDTDGERHGASRGPRRAMTPGTSPGGRVLGWLVVALRIATLIVWAQVVGRGVQAILDSSDSDAATRSHTHQVAYLHRSH
jgi:hypothetical protein